MRQSVDFENRRDEAGLTRRSVHLDDDGSLTIEGHDLGDAVEQFWGCREYEFERRIDLAGVARLRATLGVQDHQPLLEALRDRFASTNELEDAIAASGIESEFWSRVGD